MTHPVRPCLFFLVTDEQCRADATHVGTAVDGLQRFLCDAHKDADPQRIPIREFWAQVEADVLASCIECRTPITVANVLWIALAAGVFGPYCSGLCAETAAKKKGLL